MPRPPRSNPNTRTHAIELRKELTPAEGKLWSRIRNDQLGVNFRRQHAVGNYIPDFACIEKKLIIELDGSQHLEQEEYDKERTKYLESQGYKVIRFWNNEVTKNIEGVILAITNALGPQPKGKPMKEKVKSTLVDGVECKVIGGVHAGKSGTVRDIKTGKTGFVSITVVQSNGERFKTLAKNVVVIKT